MIRLGMFLPPKPDRRRQLAAQAGVRFAVTKLAPELSGRKAWERDDMAAIIAEFAGEGFTVAAFEGDPFDMSRIKLGLPGRDEDLARYCRMLANMGELGIPLLCYNFMAGVGWYRSRTEVVERGGALSSGFYPSDVAELPLKLSHEELWSNYRYFLEAVLPAAEKAGVKLALHPDDPPVDRLLGYPRIFNSAAAFRRMLELAGGSPSAGITFCAATFRTMGEEVFSLLEEFREKIFFLHLRDNRPDGDGFRETFHDDGPSDMVDHFRTFRALGLDVLLRPDHAPTMAGEDNRDPGYAAIGRIFAVGYFKGIMEALDIDYQ